MNYTEKAKLIHGDKYNYDNVNYINTKTKIKIICKNHGEFEQRPDHHLRGSGCPECSGNNKKENTTFIQESIKIHGNKYDYSVSEYKGAHKKVKIICKEHGLFEQTPRAHLNNQGCSKCAGNNKKENEEIILNLIKINGDKYDYSLVEYNGANEDIKIICKEHGIFEQSYINHFHYKQNCPKCRGFNKSNEEFITEIKLVHNNLYDYSLVNYIDCKTKIDIICKKHGIFSQEPSNHLSGQGCPYCKSSKGENEIKRILDYFKIKYIPQYTFENCKFKKKLPFDFFLPEKNLCIEFNGMQHYKSIEHFGGDIEFENRKIRDTIKKEYCKNNNIKLLIIKYNEDIQKLLEKL